MWQNHAQEEDWSFLLIYVQKTFNEDNWTSKMWDFLFEWPSGTHFTSKCYHHWATLVVHGVDGSVQFFNIKEGMNQGDYPYMIAYSIWILPLIRELRSAHPHITQPWYAYYAGVGGKLAALQYHI